MELCGILGLLGRSSSKPRAKGMEKLVFHAFPCLEERNCQVKERDFNDLDPLTLL